MLPSPTAEPTVVATAANLEANTALSLFFELESINVVDYVELKCKCSYFFGFIRYVGKTMKLLMAVQFPVSRKNNEFRSVGYDISVWAVPAEFSLSN